MRPRIKVLGSTPGPLVSGCDGEPTPSCMAANPIKVAYPVPNSNFFCRVFNKQEDHPKVGRRKHLRARQKSSGEPGRTRTSNQAVMSRWATCFHGRLTTSSGSHKTAHILTLAFPR